jgi:hypothetical protein
MAGLTEQWHSMADQAAKMSGEPYLNPTLYPEAQLEKFRLPERIASCPLEKLMTRAGWRVD